MGEPDTLLCPAQPLAAREARDWVRTRLPRLFATLPRDVALDAELLASEMVTYVLRTSAGSDTGDGAGDIRIVLTHDDYAIRLDVTEGSGHSTRRERLDDTVDFGLDIVHAASDEWGWRENSTGRRGLWALLLTAPR